MTAVDHLQARLNLAHEHLALVHTRLKELAGNDGTIDEADVQVLINHSGLSPAAAALESEARVAVLLARSWPQLTRDMVSRGHVHDWLMERAKHARTQIDRLPLGP